MMTAMIGYVCIFLSYILYQFIIVVRFNKKQREHSAILLMDKQYVLILVVSAIIYLSGSIDATIDVFSDLQRYSIGRLPFAIYALPLITTSFSSALSEGLYAFGNGYLVGYKSVVPITSVTLKKLSVKKLNRVKAVLSIHDQDKAKVIDVVMRTSKKNFDEFAKTIEVQSCA